MATFEIGKTYETSSFGDHNLIHRVTVVSRTAKAAMAYVEEYYSMNPEVA